MRGIYDTAKSTNALIITTGIDQGPVKMLAEGFRSESYIRQVSLICLLTYPFVINENFVRPI